MQKRKRAKNVQEWFESMLEYKGDDCVFWPFYKSERKERLGHYRCEITRNGQRGPASRKLCIEAHGQPPEDWYQAAHACGKGHLCCMNPNHLYWATPKENQQ